MTAPIRSMIDLVAGIRRARDERDITHETIDSISGVQAGYTSKIMAGIKNPGPVSLFPVLGALGKALAIVDDPEHLAKVKGRWAKRKRIDKFSASFNSAKRSETEEITANEEVFAFMQMIGKAGGKMSGKTRRAKAMKRRALQRVRSHAARIRWAKISNLPSTPVDR